MAEPQRVTLTMSKTFQQKEYEPVKVELSISDNVVGELQPFIHNLFSQVALGLRKQMERIPGNPYVEKGKSVEKGI